MTSFKMINKVYLLRFKNHDQAKCKQQVWDSYHAMEKQCLSIMF